MTIFRLALFLLMPGVIQADATSLETYLSAKPLRMEVRYCECAVISPDGRSPDPLPGFMDQADAPSVAVEAQDKGFISTETLFLGYALQPETGAPEAFRFQYVGDVTTSRGHNTGRGAVILEKNQWVSLWGSQGGDGINGVAVRLTETTGP